ncbi:9402_t:CDS:2 [Diversispora eburnea]|uniref:9402_t:CDS:1 n=1 Tax=Diversispora eburnea TaxID=1213867 RepID=A0A9N8ZZG3_9GLOM|nr:9402_t:CDS:2 [Diversispora eburnea]
MVRTVTKMPIFVISNNISSKSFSMDVLIDNVRFTDVHCLKSDNGGEVDASTSAQDIEYWLQRCSICFDAQLDFCLDICRDQFCRDCFQRYVKEVVQNSWGLSITKIKYFSEIGNNLRKYLETYVNCKITTKGKNSMSNPNSNDIEVFLERYQNDYMSYVSDENANIGVMEMYEYIAEKLGESLGMNKSTTKFTRRKLKIHTEMVKAAAEISSKVVALEVRPEAWKELQFMH